MVRRISVMCDTWRKLGRVCCLAVSFPVGLGSGLLPRPMEFLPPAEPRAVPAESDKAEPPPADIWDFSFPPDTSSPVDTILDDCEKHPDSPGA